MNGCFFLCRRLPRGMQLGLGVSRQKKIFIPPCLCGETYGSSLSGLGIEGGCGWRVQLRPVGDGVKFFP
jgi:hypothetical protein